MLVAIAIGFFALAPSRHLHHLAAFGLPWLMICALLWPFEMFLRRYPISLCLRLGILNWKAILVALFFPGGASMSFLVYSSGICSPGFPLLHSCLGRCVGLVSTRGGFFAYVLFRCPHLFFLLQFLRLVQLGFFQVDIISSWTFPRRCFEDWRLSCIWCRMVAFIIGLPDVSLLGVVVLA